MFDQTTATAGITVIAIFYALVYQMVVLPKIGNPRRIKEIQKMQLDAQKELEKALKSKDDKRIEEANKKMEGVMPMMSELMVLQLKPTLAIIPLLILVTNPQLNFNDAPLFVWPQNATAVGGLQANAIAMQMGLPPGAASISLIDPNNLVVSVNGTAQANFSQLNGSGRAYIYFPARPRMLVTLDNSSGMPTVRYPATRINNPLAVQNIFQNFVIVLPFSIPIPTFNLANFWNWRNTFGAFGWYYLCVLFSGLAISLIKSKLDNKSTLNTPATAPPANSDGAKAA